MHVIIGGAYSGKRQYVREQWHSFQLISAYDGMEMNDAINQEVVVYEGFEIWVSKMLKAGQTNQEIVAHFKGWFSTKEKEIFIMLEIGRGIVPISEHERRLRDVVGWIQQEAVRQADEVTSIWHGLAKKMK